MPVPTWSVGQVLASADVNNWFVPLAGLKTGNQSVTSSTTFVNDTALVVSCAASASYAWWSAVAFEAASGGDMKFQWTIPAGASIAGTLLYRTMTPGDSVHTLLSASNPVQTPGSGAGVGLGLTAFGTLIMGSTAGNLQFQWAQNTSNSTATIVRTGSVLIATRIG